MAKPKVIIIDNKEYPFESLSEITKKQLLSVRIIDKEIARLKSQISIAQTARAVYANEVKNNLPVIK